MRKQRCKGGKKSHSSSNSLACSARVHTWIYLTAKLFQHTQCCHAIERRNGGLKAFCFHLGCFLSSGLCVLALECWQKRLVCCQASPPYPCCQLRLLPSPERQMDNHTPSPPLTFEVCLSFPPILTSATSSRLLGYLEP